MDQPTLARFKQQLEELEAELRTDSKGNPDAAAPVALDTSIGRLSRMDAIQSQQMTLALNARRQQQLLRVQNALKAITAGTYGQCRRCHGPIAPDRLEAQPDAVLCMPCAAQTSPR